MKAFIQPLHKMAEFEALSGNLEKNRELFRFPAVWIRRRHICCMDFPSLPKAS